MTFEYLPRQKTGITQQKPKKNHEKQNILTYTPLINILKITTYKHKARRAKIMAQQVIGKKLLLDLFRITY